MTAQVIDARQRFETRQREVRAARVKRQFEQSIAAEKGEYVLKFESGTNWDGVA